MRHTSKEQRGVASTVPVQSEAIPPNIKSSGRSRGDNGFIASHHCIISRRCNLEMHDCIVTCGSGEDSSGVFIAMGQQ